MLSCYVSVCSEFRVAHFFNFFVLSCYVSVCSEFRVAHFFSFFVLSCYVSLCSEFRVAHFIIVLCVVLLCIFMFWVPCCSFHNFVLCCPVMYLYVLSSVLLISLVFLVLSCYVSLCSEFRVAHFIIFFIVLLCIFMFWVPCWSFHNLFLCCSVMCLYVLGSVLLISFVFVCCPVICLYVLSSVLLISLVFFVLSCYVSLCSEFRVAYFFSFFRVVLLCIFMFWVPCCSFHNLFLCCYVMCLYILSSVLLISFLFVCCPVMCLYVLSSVLLISKFLCVVLLCIFMFWVPCCLFL